MFLDPAGNLADGLLPLGNLDHERDGLVLLDGQDGTVPLEEEVGRREGGPLVAVHEGMILCDPPEQEGGPKGQIRFGREGTVATSLDGGLDPTSSEDPRFPASPSEDLMVNVDHLLY